MGVQERKEREREQRRQDILDAARTVFVISGIQNASMDKIAAQAELAKGTIYRYYRNRDELLLALLAEDLERVAEKMENAANSELEADKRLILAVEAFHTHSKESELFYKVITQVNMNELMGAGGGVCMAAEHFRDLNQRNMTLLSGIVEDGVDQGLFLTSKPPEYIVLQLLLSLKGSIMIVNNGMVPPEWMNGVDIDTILQDQAELFIAGIKNPAYVEKRSAARSIKTRSTTKRSL